MKKSLAIVENNLLDDALNWFVGAKGEYFTDFLGFTEEIKDIFGEEDKDTLQTELICDIANGFRPEKSSEFVFKAFSMRNKLKIKLNVIILTAGRVMSNHLVREMIEYPNWKGLLKKSWQLDDDYQNKNWQFTKGEHIRKKVGLQKERRQFVQK